MSLQKSSKLYKAGEKVVRLLRKKGNAAFFVGGIVRNQLLKRESDNIDIATDVIPDEVEEILEKNKITVKPIGKKYGSILAIADSFPIEITTFRSEGRYSDNRHPDKVAYIKDYIEDAKRRDFTVNALYLDPETNQILDPTKLGIKDLRLQLLRFVGDPRKRIDEDGLRMLRGIRLSSQLGFKLEKNSFAAIKTRAKYIQEISVERIKTELDKILLSENRATGVELLDATGLLKFIIPEMSALKTFTHGSKKFHLEKNMFVHTIMALDKAKTQDINLFYALLFHDIGKPAVAKRVKKDEGWMYSTKGHADASADIFHEFAKKNKFSKQSRSTIEWLIRNHMLQKDFRIMKTKKQIEIAGHPAFELLLDHWQADHHGNLRAEGFDEHTKMYEESISAAKAILRNLKLKKTLIDRLAKGDLIMKYSKLKPGIDLGRKIEDIKAQIVLGKIKTELDLKNYLSTRV